MTLTIKPGSKFETRPNNVAAEAQLQREWQKATEEAQVRVVRELVSSPEAATALESDDQHQKAALVQMLVFAPESEPIRQKLSEELSITIKSERKIVLGKVVYPLHEPMQTLYSQQYQTLLAFPLRYLDLQGKGDSYKSALADLARRFHLLFKELESLIPSQRTPEQRQHWSLLTTWVDVDKHRALTPIEFRRMGIVVSRNPFRIRWCDDDSEQVINLADSPANLAAQPVESWIAAIVEYSRKEERVLRLLSVEMIKPLGKRAPRLGDDRPLGLGDLPKVEWDSF